ncbi:DUF4097 family beta strand repeat-containing protein [Cellulomonas sp. URHB0016]
MTATLESPVQPPPPAPPRSPGSRALVWTGGVLGGLILLGSAYSATGQLVAANVDVESTARTATYDALPVVRLVADGDVTVTTGGSEVVVRRESRSALATPRYSVDVVGGRLLVQHRCDWWSPGVCSASLVVQVPEGTDVEIEASDGDVSAQALRGSLDAHTSDGATVVEDVVGDVSVHGSDGRIDVSSVQGDVDVSSSAGRVDVSDVSGRADVHSSDGRIELSAVHGDVDASASDGDVTVYGTGEPVALDISVADGHQTVTGTTDPGASVHVRIHASDGNVAYLGPNG